MVKRSSILGLLDQEDERLGSFETSLNIYQSSQHHISEDLYLQCPDVRNSDLTIASASNKKKCTTNLRSPCIMQYVPSFQVLLCLTCRKQCSNHRSSAFSRPQLSYIFHLSFNWMKMFNSLSISMRCSVETFTHPLIKLK